jgi:Globin
MLRRARPRWRHSPSRSGARTSGARLASGEERGPSASALRLEDKRLPLVAHPALDAVVSAILDGLRARHHVGFGAKSSHFAAFGEALIWGLEQQFGAAFTPELKKAWITLYDAVQGEMMRAGFSFEPEGLAVAAFHDCGQVGRIEPARRPE